MNRRISKQWGAFWNWLLIVVGWIALILIFYFSNGCSSFREDIVPPTASETAYAIDRYCLEMSGLMVFRKEFLYKVNELSEIGDLSAIDCDGDGKPDF